MFTNGMFEGRQSHSVVFEPDSGAVDEKLLFRSAGSNVPSDRGVDGQLGSSLRKTTNEAPKSRLGKDGLSKDRQPTDVEFMKERFAKLLLGEDMSGGGKGVSSALALSNAITNLAASVFGEQYRLEPMSAERKARWKKEVDWLLSVTDYIVEFAPSQQTAKDGTSMEEYLDNFKDQKEFWYVSRDQEAAEKGNAQQRQGDKWWLPKPRVSPQGLSDACRKWLQFQKDSVNQVMKAAMAINAQVLAEMEIPEAYIESLPKDRSIGCNLATKDTQGCKIVMGFCCQLGKREQFEERAEMILLLLKQRFPGIPQSALDISKIQYNKDVGHSIIESYSRVLESLAFTVLSRIDDVLFADSLAKTPPLTHQNPSAGKPPNSGEKIKMINSMEPGANGMTLLDCMGWQYNQEEDSDEQDQTGNPKGIKHKDEQDQTGNPKGMKHKDDAKLLVKPANIVTTKKISYIEKLEHLGGIRSPTSRH